MSKINFKFSLSKEDAQVFFLSLADAKSYARKMADEAVSREDAEWWDDHRLRVENIQAVINSGVTES